MMQSSDSPGSSSDSTNHSEQVPPAVGVGDNLEGKKDLFWAFVLCILAVLVVRSFLFEPFKIPSSSMVPTLKIGDHIFVSKFNFALTLPFTKAELLRTGTPKRGDVVVFLFPRDESLHYIKRVVGVPGDKVEFRGKDLYLNGELVAKEKVTDPTVIEQVTGSREISGELYRETIDGNSHYVRYTRAASYDFEGAPHVETVPPDKFFVVGDNRDDSYDSRSWGYVPRENIKGKAQIVWLSLDQDEAWGKLNKVRWGRCGMVIH